MGNILDQIVSTAPKNDGPINVKIDGDAARIIREAAVKSGASPTVLVREIVDVAVGADTQTIDGADDASKTAGKTGK